MDEDARRAALSDLYGLPGHMLWRATARVTSLVEEILPGTTDIHCYAALLALADEEPQSQQALARTIAVSATTMTSVAERLSGDGLVDRVRNPQDRRSYSLTRTPAGRAALAVWTPRVAAVEERLTAGLADGDVVRLRELLTRLAGDQLDPRTPETLRGSTGFLLTRAHQRAHRWFLTALAPIGIEPRHHGMLRAMRVAGPATQGELAALLEVSPATIVAMVDHLERVGLVVRERDPEDRRAYQVGLTPHADATSDEVTRLSQEGFSHSVGTPTDTDYRDLVRLLRQVLTTTGPA